MKPAEDLSRELSEKHGLREELPGSFVTFIEKSISEAIHQDRLAVRKKCAEVARTWADDHLTIQPSFTKIAKAIDEMEL